jgi:hypothetical protein
MLAEIWRSPFWRKYIRLARLMKIVSPDRILAPALVCTVLIELTDLPRIGFRKGSGASDAATPLRRPPVQTFAE